MERFIFSLGSFLYYVRNHWGGGWTENGQFLMVLGAIKGHLGVGGVSSRPFLYYVI